MFKGQRFALLRFTFLHMDEFILYKLQAWFLKPVVVWLLKDIQFGLEGNIRIYIFLNLAVVPEVIRTGLFTIAMSQFPLFILCLYAPPT